MAVFDLGFAGSTGFTCEALAWRDGQPWRGVDPNHRWPTDRPARRSTSTWRRRRTPSPFFAGPDPAPSMIALRPSLGTRVHAPPGRAADPGRTRPRARARLQGAGRPGRRAAGGRAPTELSRALERFARTDDPAALLEAACPRPSTSRAPDHTRSGHAHIDTAWLWPLRETRRKCARTFSTALALMDEYPDYRFACSQPAPVRVDEGVVSRRSSTGIREKVAAGQWEPVGAMWVEADCNLPSGESLVRQILHGKRFFMEEFGVETHELWLPDVFGYPASLPQLIAELGRRVLPDPEAVVERHQQAGPPHVQVGGHRRHADLHALPAGRHLQRRLQRHGDRARAPPTSRTSDHSSHSLYLYRMGRRRRRTGAGHDRVGAPAAQPRRGAPRSSSRVRRILRPARKREAHDLTTWVGELYLELHRGTYTTQARTKKREPARRAGAARSRDVVGRRSRLTIPRRTSSTRRGSCSSSTSSTTSSPARASTGCTRTPSASSRPSSRSPEASITSAQAALAGAGDNLVAFNVNSHARREVVEVGDRPDRGRGAGVRLGVD